MSRDQQPDGSQVPDSSDEPTTGPPAGAYSASGPRPADGPAPAGSTRGPDPAGSTPGATDRTGTTDPLTGSTTYRVGSARPGSPPRARTSDGTTRPVGSPASRKAAPEAGPEARKRRKRRLVVAGISVAAALIVIALCAGGLAILRTVDGFQDDATDAREDRRLRDSACLELEDRLNRLVPPGATTTPQTRAAAVRNENAATRIYVGRLGEQRVSDGWRELLDARTSFAEALDAQTRSRTAAFYVAPVPRDGESLADQLARWSPEACAGPIRRLAAPDL